VIEATSGDAPPLAVRHLVKNYQALRPLRLDALTLQRGDIIALDGLDAAAAEMLVSLITGAALPDSGEVRLFGQTTAAVTDSDAWLAMLDAVGIVTDRAVLIAQFAIDQNIAMPFTLEIDPIAAHVMPRVIELAQEVGLRPDELGTPVAQSPPAVQARVRLARALALEPSLLLAEHPTATLPREVVKAFAADVGRVARARNLAVLAITADPAFAAALGGKTLVLEPATGALKAPSAWTKLFRR
jgi:predicted ABC-type transport system involved in lysophospholipase L1 biosynthesis ATPase subunit